MCIPTGKGQGNPNFTKFCITMIFKLRTACFTCFEWHTRNRIFQLQSNYQTSMVYWNERAGRMQRNYAGTWYLNRGYLSKLCYTLLRTKKKRNLSRGPFYVLNIINSNILDTLEYYPRSMDLYAFKFPTNA